MKIFIAGDRYFHPEIVKAGLEKKLAGCGEEIIYESVQLPFPIDHLVLTDDYRIPTGMAWDQNMDEDYGTQGVREYYGRNDTLLGKLGDAEVLIIHGAALPKTVLDEAPNLKMICCMRGGPVNLAIDEIRRRGIVCVNSPGKNAEAVAEYVIGILLSHIRHIPEGKQGIKEEQYIQRFNAYDQLGFEFLSKTFGLVGFGRIGQRLAAILNGFGAKVLAFDPFMSADQIAKLQAEPCELSDLLARSDVVSIHARSKERLIGAEEFAQMKEGALFINTARGGLVDYPALYEALTSGHLSGAVLDVIGTEPFSFYRKMLALPNVTITPHMAGTSRETVQRGIDMVGEDIRRFIAGEPLLHPM